MWRPERKCSSMSHTRRDLSLSCLWQPDGRVPVEHCHKMGRKYIPSKFMHQLLTWFASLSLSRSPCRNWRQTESTNQSLQNTSRVHVVTRFPLETISPQSLYFCRNPFPLDLNYVWNVIMCTPNLSSSSSLIDSTVSSPLYIFMYGYVSLSRSQNVTPELGRCRPYWERYSRSPCCHVQSYHFVLPECLHCNINLDHLILPFARLDVTPSQEQLWPSRALTQNLFSSSGSLDFRLIVILRSQSRIPSSGSMQSRLQSHWQK